jgi:two-component system nitrate/nitrite response regulator NarL
MPTAQPIRLLIAADQRLFREALRLLLEREPCFRVVGYGANAVETMALVRALDPDVLLLDLDMPGSCGLEILRAMRACTAPPRTIVIISSMTRPVLIEALRLGAFGVVMKDADPELLFKSIHAVMNGQHWVAREATSDIVAALRDATGESALSTPRPFHLTRRELDVIEAVVRGYSNKEIASGLSVTEDTVKHHLSSIFDKVGVSTRLELALFAKHHRLF